MENQTNNETLSLTGFSLGKEKPLVQIPPSAPKSNIIVLLLFFLHHVRFFEFVNYLQPIVDGWM